MRSAGSASDWQAADQDAVAKAYLKSMPVRKALNSLLTTCMSKHMVKPVHQTVVLVLQDANLSTVTDQMLHGTSDERTAAVSTGRPENSCPECSHLPGLTHRLCTPSSLLRAFRRFNPSPSSMRSRLNSRDDQTSRPMRKSFNFLKMKREPAR